MNDKMLLYIPIVVWGALVIVYFIFLTRKFTFGNWTKENPNPFNDETLCMPKGTFRGILTLTIVFTAVMLEVFTLNDSQAGSHKYEDSISKFMTAFQMVLAFYFGSQVMTTLTNAETKKTETIVNAEKDDDNPPKTI